MANDALKIVTHEDAEQAKRPLVRVPSPNPADSVDPTKLIDILGDIDDLKREIHDRMRRIEAVKQAKSLLMEDAMRTEALNKRLAEISKIMSAAQSGLQAGESDFESADVVRLPVNLAVKDTPSLMEYRPSPALAWPRLEEVAKPEFHAVETPEAVAPFVAEAHGVELEAAPAAELTISEAATRVEEPAVAEILEMPMPAMEVAFSTVMEAVATAVEQEEAGLNAVLEVEMPPAMAPVAGVSVAELETAKQSYGHAEALVAEARRLLQESTARLDMAVNREERVAADLMAAQELTAAANASVSEKLLAWEQQFGKAEEAAAEAKRFYEKSASQLQVAASKEEQSSADFHAAQVALTSAYESATQRLEAAEKYCKDGDQFMQETRQLLEKMKAELALARSGATSATEDLQSARQELTTAYQFASVAAQRRLDAAEFFQKISRWVVMATALAWVVAIWMGWLAMHKSLSIAIPFAVTCGVVGAAMFISKRNENSSEEA